MKICVLVSGEEALAQAGVRIRYGRIQPALRASGHELDIRAIDGFASRETFTHDVYIVSKVYDARSLVVADALKRIGIPVGADLFDDYFTQAEDPRLARYRQWLDAFADLADFLLCSTSAMQRIAQSYAPGAPSLVMNDPAPPCDIDSIGGALERKLVMMHATGLLRVGWFGIGDNPSFPVGLHDLAHFGEALAGLRGHGFDVALSVLTNRRSLTPSGLGMLARLPVPYHVDEWSEEAEEALMGEIMLGFLPVSAQPFSTAKSLNRAVSCLATGTQILSAGYPLYDELGDFIYRDAAMFMSDLAAGRQALRAETVPGLLDALRTWADADAESRRLVAFLEPLHRDIARSLAPGPSIVVHGHASQREVHRFSQALGALSVASPYCNQRFNFDIRFEFIPEVPGMAVHIAERLVPQLAPEAQAALRGGDGQADTPFRTIEFARALPNIAVPAAVAQADSLAAVTATYARTMSTVLGVLAFLFPGATVHVSEASRLPLRAGRPSGPAMAAA
jgi:hypothetical protein